MTITPNRILDLHPGIGQVAFRYDYDLLTPNLQPMGQVHPSAQSITNDTSATIKRTLRGFTLQSGDARHVNPSTDRLRVSMVLEDGTRWDRGVFMFTDDSTTLGSSHRFYNATLVDQGLRINQQIRWPFGVVRYGDLTRALIEIIERMGIFDYDVDLPIAMAGEAIAWPTGTLGLAIMTQLVQLAGGVGPYFSNSGRLTVKQSSPMDQSTAHEYPVGSRSRIVRDTLQVSKRFTEAPNVYVVEGSDLATSAVTATAFIDPRLEHSVERIGYERPDVRKLQGVNDSDHAQRIVRNLAENDPRQLEHASFGSFPDPRHDTYDAVHAAGVLYRELSWTLNLEGDRQMAHEVAQQSPDLVEGVSVRG